MLFCARTHTWLQRCGGNVARLGLTARGLEDVGSIDRIMPLVEAGDRVDRNTPLVEIEWAAYRIGAADELYHSAWANVEGSYTLEGPAPCTLRTVHHTALAKPQDICDRTWLVEVELDEGASLPELLDAEAYDAHVAGLDRGPFADEDAAHGDLLASILCPEYFLARSELAGSSLAA